MKHRKNIWSTSLLAILLIAVGGCGTPGTQIETLPINALNYDFRVISTSPQNGSTNINANTSQMQLFFSEEIDANTTENNVILKKSVNQSETVITNGSITTNGTLIDVDFGGTLDENTIYSVVLLPGLRSVNNNALYNGDYPEGVQASFDTGVGFGNSVAGPPKVDSINKYTNFNGCFSAVIRFNEDVSLFLNDVVIDSTLIFGTGGGQVDSAVFPFYSTRQDVWVVEANCTLLGVWDVLQQIRVIVYDAIDLEGNNLDCSNGNCDRTF